MSRPFDVVHKAFAIILTKRTPSEELDHVDGCPGWAECCTEYGYCHPKVFSHICCHSKLSNSDK